MIENTSDRDMLTHLVGSMGSRGTSGYIEEMEAAGQAQVVSSMQLPIQMGDRAAFEALGFSFGEEVDDLFLTAKLPEGWSKEGSDHSMHSYVVDADGYRRVNIFYKAAFYDRRADMRIMRDPKTRAQDDAYMTVVDPEYQAGVWRSGDSRREGPNYVYVLTGRYGDAAPAGKHAYSDDGRRLEIVIAPDGSKLERREFTTEPVESDY